jgi:glycosyltransferase involved in cell wall biosynthesis
MRKNLQIIEPTLSGEAGHCRSFLESLCQADASGACHFTVWGGKTASLPRSPNGEPEVKRFFYRKIRKVQEFFLLRRLLAKGERIFISTAGRVDLLLLDLAASGPIPASRVFLFFHWVRPDSGKLAYFRKIAAKHPNLVILGPTRSVVDVFAGCGFGNCHVVPYPITKRSGETLQARPFRHLLFAGAARKDKGFSHVVRLLAHLKDQGLSIPVSLQTSPAHYDKYDEETSAALKQVPLIGYPQLSLTPETLASDAYFEMFHGGVCLQPYDAEAFADRISGITLDALSMGAPLVTLSGTWMARVVERFGAGVVIEKPEPELLLAAAQLIISDYPRFAACALRAGEALQREHSAGHLLGLLTT